MSTIKNKRSRPILIVPDASSEGKTVGLLAKGTAEVDDRFIKSTQLQRFIDRGDIVVLSSKKKKSQTYKTSEKTEVVQDSFEKPTERI